MSMDLRTSILICLVMSAATGFSQNPVCGFQYKKTITINGDRVAGGPHTNFPMLISHTDTDLRTTGNGGDVTNANGYDIIFADDNGDPLSFQLEHYVATTGQYVAWVLIPSITNGVDVDIHILYGKSSITTNQSTNAVWGSNYHAVWHLNNNSFNDATSNGRNGTNNGTSDQASAAIAGGRSLTDPNHWIEVSSFPNMSSSFSISAWVYTVDNAEAGQRIFCDDANNSNGGYALSIGDPGSGRIRFYIRGLSNVSLDSPVSTISNNTWHHCVAVADMTGLMKYLYVDGNLVASQSFTGTLGTDNGNASIGGEVAAGESGNRFDGRLDEVRSVARALDADWIETEYNSQDQPTSYPGSDANDFYSVGSEEDVDHDATNGGDWDQTSVWNSGQVPNDIFDNVDIQRDVDVDAGSANYTICDCAMTTNGGQAANLDISDVRVLTIRGDLTGSYTGSAANGIRIQLDNTAQLLVEGDVTLTRTNTNATGDVTITLNNSTVFTVDDDFTFTHGGGDDFTIDLNSASALNVGGNLSWTHSGGDDSRIDIDETAVMTVTGNFTQTHSGGDDSFIAINNNAGTASELNIGGNYSYTHSAGDDFQIIVDDASSVFAVTGTFNLSCPGTSDAQLLTFDLDGGQFTTGAVTASRSTDYGYILWDMDGGDFTCSSFTGSSAGTLGNAGRFEIAADVGSEWICNGNFNHTMTGADDMLFNINLSDNTTGAVRVTGDMNFTRSDGDDIEFHLDDDGSEVEVNGNMTVTSTGGEQFIINLDEDASFTVDGNFTYTHSAGQAATLNMEHNANASNPTFSVGGNHNITITGGSDDFTHVIDGGTFNVGGSINLTQSAATAAENIQIDFNNDAVGNVTGGINATLSGGDDIRIDLGETVAGSTCVLNVGGTVDLDHNGATGGDQLTFRLYNDTEVNIDGDLIIDSDFSSADVLLVSLNSTSEMTVLGDIEFVAAFQGESELELNETSALNIGGNFVRAASPSDFGILDCNSTSTLRFIGSTNAQIFPQDDGGGTDEFDFRNVVINNTFGTAPQLTMQGLATVHTGITFTDGVISSTATNVLVIDNGATTSGASNNSFVDGFVRKVGNTPAGEFAGNGYAFPVGDVADYQPIYISAPSLTTDAFTASYVHTDPDATYDIALREAGLDHISSTEYWELNRTAGTSNVSVRLSWDGNSGGVTDLTTLRVSRWNGAQWANHGNGGTTGNTTAGTVVSSAVVSSFSPFALASTTTGNPLPVTLLSFTGRHVSDGNLLEWSTATESNSHHFTLYRSPNNEHFTPIASRDAAGFSSSPLHYSSLDTNAPPGLSYYRLSQTDIDGAVQWFETVTIYNATNITQAVVFPNPASNEIVVRSGAIAISNIAIKNTAGLVVLSARPSVADEYSLSVGSLPSGVYTVVITFENGTTEAHLVVKADS